jgi:hypothetical protein
MSLGLIRKLERKELLSLFSLKNTYQATDHLQENGRNKMR